MDLLLLSEKLLLLNYKNAGFIFQNCMKNCRRLKLNQDVVHILYSYLQLELLSLPIFCVLCLT